MDETKLRDRYDSLKPLHERVLHQVLAAVEDYRLETVGQGRIHSVKSRIKAFRSFRHKSDGKGVADPDQAFVLIKDLVGVRIVCTTLQGRAEVSRWIESVGARGDWEILKNEDNVYDTGYRSRHFLIKVRSRHWDRDPEMRDRLQAIPVEIQVRTILEEAWGELEHPIVYKARYKVDPAILPSFRALAARLHAADVAAQRLIRRTAEQPVAQPTARRPPLRSFRIDVDQLGLTDAALAKNLAGALDLGEDHRERREYDAAEKIHQALCDDIELKKAFTDPSRRAFLYLELGLDRLARVRAKIRGAGKPSDDLRQQLAAADEAFRMAEALDTKKELLFVPYRRAIVARLDGDLQRALELLRTARAVLKEHDVPPYLRSTFNPGIIETSIGALLARPTSDVDKAAQLAEASEFLTKAVANLADVSEKDRDEEWMGEFVRACNNAAFFLYERGRFKEAQEPVERAIKHTQTSVWEHDLQFLDTRFAIAVALLGENPKLDELVQCDAYRSTLLDVLLEGGDALDSVDVGPILDRIDTLGGRLRRAVVAAAGNTPAAS